VPPILIHTCLHTFSLSLFCVGDQGLWTLTPNIGAHCVLSSRTTLMMPSRQFSHRLHPDEDMPQTSTHSQPPTQILSTIAEGLEHATFGDIPEFDVIPPPNNVSTAAAGLSQNAGGTNSTQINEGAPPQSPP
jgi:hypothetical protein